MAKKMLTIKIEINTIELLKIIADKEGRSQGKQVEQLILREAKRLDVTLPNH